jgi:ubiquinol-cytochrome c reductase iron-sulfur subunit
MAESAMTAQAGGTGESRRDFLNLTAGAMGAVAVGAVAWPIIDSMNPSADVLALASTEVDLSPIEEGQRITVTWRGKPIFIDNRTPEQIEAALDVDLESLPDPQSDAERIKEGRANWLVLVGVCTHLGCVPLGQRTGEPRGEWAGWFCPCHGSHYDTSGRIRKGPAPANLPVPPYEFISDETIFIG